VALRNRIEEIVLEMPGYGYRPVPKQLQKEGWCVNHKRVLRIMRAESLLCRLQKRFVITTDSQHAYRTYPNLLKTVVLTRPDQVWQADITYIRLPAGFCYLAALIDAFSRFCVGWHLSQEIDTRLTLAALEMAVQRRQPGAGLIHHSDRGVQYASAAYILRFTYCAWSRLQCGPVCRPKAILTTMPKQKASSKVSSERRCISRNIAPLPKRRTTLPLSLKLFTIRSGCIPVWAIRRLLSSKPLITKLWS